MLLRKRSPRSCQVLLTECRTDAAPMIVSVRALSSLPKTHRDAFLLQQCGYSLKEIAAMEVEKGTLTYENIETIKRRVFNARKILREKLTRDGENRQIDTEDNNDLFNSDEAAGGLQI